MKPWRKKAFPLHDDLAILIDGTVATGESAFRPGRPGSNTDNDGGQKQAIIVNDVRFLRSFDTNLTDTNVYIGVER